MADLRITTKALPEHNRRRNRAMLLQTLFHEGPRSRADIARGSGLNKVTVSAIVGDLIEQGILVEAGHSTDVRVGKPATLVAIDDDSRSVISLDLSDALSFRGAVMNLRSRASHQLQVDVRTERGDAAIARVMALAEELLAQAPAPVLGIGVGSPGVVDRTGVVRFAPHLGWFHADLRGALSERFGLPVHVVNDANGMALAVHTFRENDGRSILIVTIQRGAGAGLIVGESLIDGMDFTAGEIGHVVVDPRRETDCLCGRAGCLDSIVAVPAIRRRLDAGEDRQVVMDDAADALAAAVAPIISLLGATHVVIVGPEDVYDEDFARRTREHLAERTFPSTTSSIGVDIASDGGLLALQGPLVAVLSAELGIS
ncbi:MULTISPECIES: ROK family transcriptional regulator [unclassified Microbacterium]|uniref:ROK family transcriptional regulator n=1 Tax=unclassified Microbacterium TaxID=2609290 RepID=UPI001601EC8F|nr:MULTISPECIES: ROK family transcriptional regulator [unclassified Microbacterium]MBT2484443.1 ROK family transcriptional regulator [Microbacterium sp. ISL-108]